jgi:hypothetical protein
MGSNGNHNPEVAPCLLRGALVDRSENGLGTEALPLDPLIHRLRSHREQVAPLIGR